MLLFCYKARTICIQLVDIFHKLLKLFIHFLFFDVLLFQKNVGVHLK